MIKRNLPGFVLAIVAAVIICLAWSKILSAPNHWLLTSGGDAFKNYYTPAWYVANDSGAHFSGMHYPFGEHVVFTDDQPAITWIINWVDDHVVPIHDHTIGILHVLMLCSIWITILLLFHILRYYRMPAWYAAWIALCIGLLSPQLERFWGHFALSYTMFVPLVWWQLIRTAERKFHWKQALLLCSIIFFFGWIHMYYALIAALFLGFYAIAFIVLHRSRWKEGMYAMLCAAIPVIGIMTCMHFTDTVNDRPETPYGFFRYKASFQSVFLPKNGTLTNQLRSIFHFGHSDAEGYAFVGYAGFLFLIVLLVVFVKRYLHNRSLKRMLIPMPQNMHVFIWAGIGMLMFSMALPFSLGLQFLLDIITPLKQFRSPGRFAWAFYYIYLTGISVLAWMLFKKIKKRHIKTAYLFIGAFMIILAADAGVYFKNIASGIQKNNAENPFDGKIHFFADALNGTGYVSNDFDAILFLPSFYMGSEKVYVDRTSGNLSKAMELSYQTHLPLVNYMMSRTSLSTTFQSMQIVGHPFIAIDTTSDFFKGFKSNRLLVMVKEDLMMNKGEQYIIDHSKRISERGGFGFYVYDVKETYHKGAALARASYQAEKDSLKTFTANGCSYQAAHALDLFYMDDFSGKTGLVQQADGRNVIATTHKWEDLANIPVSVTQPIWIELSVWCQSAAEAMAYPYLMVSFKDANGVQIAETSIAPTQSSDALDGWVRASTDLELNPATRSITISMSYDTPGMFSNLMVRHTGWNAYTEVVSPESFVINNIPVGK